MESLRGSIVSSAVNNVRPRDVSVLSDHEEGGRLWELRQNIQDGKMLNFLEEIVSLRDGGSPGEKEEDDA